MRAHLVLIPILIPIMSPIRRRLAAILLSLAVFLPTAAVAEERWLLVSISGQPVGSFHESVAGRDGTLVTETETRMVINRLGHRVEVAVTATSRESAEGRLRDATTGLKMSDQTTTMAAEVGEGTVRLRSQAGGKSFERTVPFSGELLGPEGIRQATVGRLARPGDVLQVQTWSPELGAVATVHRTLLALEPAQGTAAARKIEEKTEGYPGVRTLWLDGDGRLLASEEAGPFGVVRTALSDEATARRTMEAGGELPAEAYTGTIARTQVRIPQARRLAWMKLRITHHNPGLGWPDLDRPGQRVVAKTDAALEVEISRRRPPAGPHPFPVAATAATREYLEQYLEPNAFIQSDEPALRAKAREIVGGETDLVKAVLELERWVAESMQFDLGIAMAPSVELFQNRRGTCVGYATLLTTLARSVGIPSRVVMGYVYVDGMFGGHAWMEALVGDDWVPFDAAVVGPGSADAARFAFLATSLRDGAGEFSAGPALQMYGQIDVRVLGLAVDGQPRRVVDAEARPYAVSGDVYRNAGLGIELKKPAGFRWVDLDGVWPEKVLAGMAGDPGERIVLESRSRFPWEEDEAAVWKALDARIPGGRHQRLQVAGRTAYWIEGEGKAAVALADGEEVWTLAAEGPEAAARLREAAAGWRMER